MGTCVCVSDHTFPSDRQQAAVLPTGCKDSHASQPAISTDALYVGVGGCGWVGLGGWVGVGVYPYPTQATGFAWVQEQLEQPRRGHLCLTVLRSLTPIEVLSDVRPRPCKVLGAWPTGHRGPRTILRPVLVSAVQHAVLRL